jgi:elongation factor P
MAFGITDLKKGTLFELDGSPYKVVDYSQKVMGRGGSIVNVRIKNMIDGKVLDKTFKGNEAIEPAEITSRNVQYLYNDGTKYYFMDNESYEQIEIITDLVADSSGFLKEGDVVKSQSFKGRVINIELPKNVDLKVTYTEDVVKGDTANSVQKEAELETGIKIKVPAFIKQGDIISVSTEDGSYRERKKD